MQKYCSKKSNTIYIYNNRLYLNITNRCPIKCVYCIKYKWQWKFRGNYLKLIKEPSYKQIVTLLKKYDLTKFKEIIFCGYGEPFTRFALVKKVAHWIKKNFPKTKIRVNTNGLGEVINKKNICKELVGLVDTISISLNAHNEKVYSKLHKTKIKFPLNKIIKFIKNCKKYVKNTIVTTIKHKEIDISKIRKLTKKLKVKFKIREFLDQYESE